MKSTLRHRICRKHHTEAGVRQEEILENMRQADPTGSCSSISNAIVAASVAGVRSVIGILHARRHIHQIRIFGPIPKGRIAI